MSNAARLLPTRLAAAAAAIANARAARRGAPTIVNVLDLMPQDVFQAIVEDAQAALDAAQDSAIHGTVPVPRQRGPLREADVEALRLDLDAGTLLILSRDRASRAAAALSAVGAETALLGHEEAHLLWGAVSACLRTFPAEQPATEGPVS